MSDDITKTMDPQEQELRKLRGHLAFKGKVKPYQIFTDNELKLLLEAKPRNLIQLANIKGFPETGERVKKYGADIVSVFTGTNSHKEMNNF